MQTGHQTAGRVDLIRCRWSDREVRLAPHGPASVRGWGDYAGWFAVVSDATVMQDRAAIVTQATQRRETR